MESPGQKRGMCGHTMVHFDAHFKCARCREKTIGQDPCVEKKQCQFCDNFSEDQKKQLANPTYRACKELQKTSSSPPNPPQPRLLILLTLLCWGRSRARVTIVIDVKLLVRNPKSPLTSPLPRRNLAEHQQTFKLISNLWMTSGQSVLPGWKPCS